MSDVLRKAGGLSITFTPILAVYLLHSQFTLQVWKAARHIPPPLHTQSNASDDDEVKKAKRQYKFEHVCWIIVLSYLLCTGFAAYVIVEVDDAKRIDPRIARQYVASLLFPFLYMISNPLSIVLCRCERVLYRGNDQKLFVISNRSKPWSYFRDVLISFFESAIVTSAILFPLKVVASLIGASIVYTLTTSDMPRRFSAKDHIQCSLGLALCPVLFCAPTLFGEVNHVHRILSAHIMQFGIDWPSLILGSLLHSGPLQFIASFYRLDFAESEKDHDDLPTEFARTTVGITVPFAFAWPSTRSSPYFLSALAGWVCTVLIVAQRLEVVTYANLGFYVAFFSPLLMTLAVACAALIRGEARKVWNYEENWGFDNDITKPETAMLAVLQNKYETQTGISDH